LRVANSVDRFCAREWHPGAKGAEGKSQKASVAQPILAGSGLGN